MADNIEAAAVICRNREFELKLKIVMAFISKEVLAEPANTTFHLSRVRWANRALTRPDTEVKKVCMVMSITPGVELDATDNALIQAVRADVDTFAGAFLEEAEPLDGQPTTIEITETDHDNNPVTAPVVTTRRIMNFFRSKK
jgi:hypothetical protein